MLDRAINRINEIKTKYLCGQITTYQEIKSLLYKMIVGCEANAKEIEIS